MVCSWQMEGYQRQFQVMYIARGTRAGLVCRFGGRLETGDWRLHRRGRKSVQRASNKAADHPDRPSTAERGCGDEVTDRAHNEGLDATTT